MLTIYGLRLVSSDQYVYVGQTRLSGEKRFRSHVRSSRINDIGKMKPVHRWIREQGEANVTFDVLDSSELTDENWLDENEVLWIAKLRGDGHALLNSQDGGSYQSQTPVAREKRIRRGEDHYNYGKAHSEETLAKLSSSRRARPTASEETRQKISSAMKGENNPNFGKSFSEDTRRKMSDAATGNTKRRGTVHTDATKDKIRAARKQQAPLSEEARQKISEANKGKVIPPEQRAKISAALTGEKHHAYGKPAVNKGVPMSDEQKKKLSETLPKSRCAAWHGKRNYVDPDCAVCADRVAAGEVERFSTPDEIDAAKELWKANRDPEKLATHKANLSASQRKRAPVSDETKAKLSAAGKGRSGKIPSAETRAKQSAAKKGRPMGEAQKRGMMLGLHTKWHADRGITKPDCEFCELPPV